MTITKKELITLLREDMSYQRNELTPSFDAIFKINGMFIYNDIFVRTKVVFEDYCVSFGIKTGETVTLVTSIPYSEVISVGYLYNDEEKLRKRISELRNN